MSRASWYPEAVSSSRGGRKSRKSDAPRSASRPRLPRCLAMRTSQRSSAGSPSPGMVCSVSLRSRGPLATYLVPPGPGAVTCSASRYRLSQSLASTRQPAERRLQAARLWVIDRVTLFTVQRVLGVHVRREFRRCGRCCYCLAIVTVVRFKNYAAASRELPRPGRLRLAAPASVAARSGWRLGASAPHGC